MSNLATFFAQRTLKELYTEERAQFLKELMQASKEGHLCLEKEEVPTLPSFVLEEGKDLFHKVPVIRDGSRYYLQRNWVLESYLLEQVDRLNRLVPPSNHDVELFKVGIQNSQLLPKQKEAVERAFHKSFSIFYGGPGTGKTYTAAALVRLLLETKTQEKYKVILTAPTGRAASHLQTILGMGIQAMTLHRLLRILPGEMALFGGKKIDADLVIVDEASMIDVSLFAKLFESIGSETRLVLMGDPDQLPPIDTGSLFKEMADLFGVRLEKSMRTDDAGLDRLSQTIQQGGEVDKSYLLNWPFDGAIGKRLYEEIQPLLSWEKPDPEKCFKELNRVRVLGALRQGPFGTDALNEQIVAQMRSEIRPGQWWVIPIMIRVNAVEEELYNGTNGVLIGKSSGGVVLSDGVAYFPEPVSFRKLPPFEVAFCISIHKSQGSEFERVYALFPEGSDTFGREAFYTAITRAKKEVKLLVEQSVLRKMLGKRSIKNSGFTERFLRKTRQAP